MYDINVDMEALYYSDKQIEKIKDDLESVYNDALKIDCLDLSSSYLLSETKTKISSELKEIDLVYEKVHNTKILIEENNPEVVLLFDYLDGDFIGEDGYFDKDAFKDILEERNLTDEYNLLSSFDYLNELIANQEFMRMWQKGEFIDQNGNIDYNKLNNSLPEYVDMEYVEQTTKMYKENQLFVKAFEAGKFFDREGNIDYSEVNKFLNVHPNVTCAQLFTQQYQENQDFLQGFETGKFFDREGNIDYSEVNRYLQNNPNVTCAEQVIVTYQANNDFLEMFSSGAFVNDDNSWNDEAYMNYIKTHPNVTCGEQVKESYQKSYQDALNQYYADYLEQSRQVAAASYTWGVLDALETVGDGLLWLASLAAAGQEMQNSAASWSVSYQMGSHDRQNAIKETGAELIAFDWSAAGYAATVDLLDIREEIAYGMTHQVCSAAGSMTGYVLLSFIPGAQPVVGALAAAGSSTEKALNSGATIDEAYAVGLGQATLGLASGYGLDKIGAAAGNATNLWQVGGYMGLAALDTAAEPVLGSVIEYVAYGNDYYDNWGEYYVESGAALNTFIAVGVGEVNVGINGLKGVRTTIDNNKKIEINKTMDDLFTPGSYEGTSAARTQSWQDYFDSTYGVDADVSHVSGYGIDNTADFDTINYSRRVENIIVGQKTFENLNSICQKYGLSLEAYLDMTRTPTHKLTNFQRQAVYSVNRECLGDLVNIDGTLRDGVEITKYIGRNSFEQIDAAYYQPGKVVTARGCVALASDCGALSMSDAVSRLGLDYSASPFYKNCDPSSGLLEEYCYRIVGESQSPVSGRSSITMRVSSTTDYVPSINGDISAANAKWLQNANENVSSLRHDSGCEYITVENPDWGYNSPNNPDTGMGVTKNRDSADCLGAFEFNGSHGALTGGKDYNTFINGRVERVYLDGRVELVYLINSKGEFVLSTLGGN